MTKRSTQAIAESDARVAADWLAVLNRLEELNGRSGGNVRRRRVLARVISSRDR